MALITLSSSIRINTATIVSVSDIRSKYLTGLVLPSTVDDSVIQHYIDTAVSEIESFLSLRLRRQIIKEEKSFYRQDWLNWGYLKATYPVVCPVGLIGRFGQVSQITYPRDWLSSRYTNDAKNYSRTLSIVPSGNQGTAQIITFIGSAVGMSLNRWDNIPDYWEMEYVTGWDDIPKDILNVVCLLVTASVLQIISDAIVSGSARQMIDSNGNATLVQSGVSAGFGLGLSSKSISIDGLSQSTSTYVNGQTGLFGARLKQVLDSLNPATPGSLMNRLYDQYGALVMGVA